MPFSPYYSITKALNYAEHISLEAAKLATDHIILHIDFGSTPNQDYNNDNFIFQFYSKDGEPIKVIEENGWTLSFSGPLADRQFYLQKRMYITLIAEPNHPQDGIVVENQQPIGIDNFVSSYKRFRNIATPDRKEYVSVLWENMLLRDKQASQGNIDE